MGYSRQVVKSISWMSAFRVFTRLLSFLKTAILARALSPAQFGVFGIAALVLEFLEMLTETGINIFLIQTKNNIDEYISTAWVVSILRGIFISLLIIISSPYIASFFNTPEAHSILLFISIVPFIRGFINPAEVKFQKDLQFDKEFLFRGSIFLFDALVSIIFVLVTQSVYSLVWGMIAGALLEVLVSFILIKPRPSLKINNNYFSEIFHSGKWVTIYGVFNYIAQQGDNIMVGRLLGASSLGVYQMAYKISTLPISEVTDVVSKVTFPVYSKIGGDKKRLKAAFLKSTLVISGATIVMGVVLFLFPREAVNILLGDKWLSAIPVLQILAVYGVLRAISGSASSLFLGTSKQQYVTIMTFFRFAGLAVTIYPFITMFGMVGAGYSALFSVLVEIPFIIYFVWRTFK